MLREGWEWCIVPAAVDIMFPAFAKIAQQALNISNHIVDGSFGGLWAIYCMRVKILADEMKVLESGVAFLQCLSMSVHWGHLNSAAEGCKKMMCTLGQDIAVQMQPPPASCASSSAVPTAGVMVPAQQVAVASTAYGSVTALTNMSDLAEANPWASMMD